MQHAVAPWGLAGQEDHPAVIGGKYAARRFGPGGFQRPQHDLHHHHADGLAGFVAYRLRQEVARHGRRDAFGIEGGAAVAHRPLEIRAEIVGVAHIAGADHLPVAGGQCHPVAIKHGERGRGHRAVDAFQLAADALGIGRADDGLREHRADFRIQRQHRRQHAVAFDQRLQRIAMQAQLLARLCGIGMQAAPLQMAHHHQAQHCNDHRRKAQQHQAGATAGGVEEGHGGDGHAVAADSPPRATNSPAVQCATAECVQPMAARPAAACVPENCGNGLIPMD
ncbi:hypothetical protein D3C81_1028820 [compost metagenome]